MAYVPSTRNSLFITCIATSIALQVPNLNWTYHQQHQHAVYLALFVDEEHDEAVFYYLSHESTVTLLFMNIIKNLIFYVLVLNALCHINVKIDFKTYWWKLIRDCIALSRYNWIRYYKVHGILATFIKVFVKTEPENEHFVKLLWTIFCYSYHNFLNQRSTTHAMQFCLFKITYPSNILSLFTATNNVTTTPLVTLLAIQYSYIWSYPFFYIIIKVSDSAKTF